MRPAVTVGIGQRQVPGLRMTQALHRAMAILRMDNAAICGLLAAEAADNPCLRVTLPDPAPRRGPPNWRPQAGGDGTEAERLAAPAPGLHAHVAAQISLIFRIPAERRIAETFLEALEPSGWLGEDLSTLAARAGCPRSVAEAILSRLQQIDPAGLFARSLAECLALQLADQDALSAPMRSLLDHLPLLAAGDMAALRRRCGVDAQSLAEMVARIRRLDPKPGSHFGDPPDIRRPPDLIVDPSGTGGWQVRLSTDTLPVLALDLTLGSAAQKTTARWLDRTVGQRNRMLLNLTAHVAARQSAFLAAGPAHLATLTCAEVARALGCHETTVNRLRRGILVATPRGAVPLATFFPRGRSPSPERASPPAAAVQFILTGLIHAEPPSRPLTDAALAEALAQKGITISRRMIAHHRSLLHIAPAAQRRSPKAD